MALGTDYIIKYLSDISGAVKGAKQLEAVNLAMAKNIQNEYGQATKIIRTLQPDIKFSTIKSGQFAGLQQEIVKTGQYIETVSGKFGLLGKTQTFVQGQLLNTKTSFTGVTKEIANGNNVLANWSNAIWQLASRALLTIPIWIALRSAIMGIFQGISGGFNSMIELDRALNKARVAAGSTIEEMKKEMATLKPFMEKLAQETGQPIKDLGEVFFSFRASGLDFKTSLAGMEVSNKIARTQMGDVKKVAESLAKVMLLLGDSFESGGTSIDKMNTFAALSYELNTKNAFSIDQLTDSLLSFAPSAKTAGLSAEQAVKLMATLNSAGILGPNAGKAFGTGLSKFILNFKELTPLLGIKIDPKQGTFAALMQTLDALKKLNSQGVLSPAFNSAIEKLFAGEKGGKTIKALISIYDLLKSNIALTGDINKMNTAFDVVNKSIQVESEKFIQLREAAFRTFVTAALGGENFAQTLIKINKLLSDSIQPLKTLGTSIKVVFDNLGLIAGTAFVLKFVSVASVSALFSRLLVGQAAMELLGVKLAWIFSRGFVVGLKVLGKLALGGIVASFATAGIAGVLGAVVTAALSPIALIGGLIGKLVIDNFSEKLLQETNAKNAKIMEASDKMIDALRGNVSIPDLEVMIKKLTIELPDGKPKIAEIGALRKQIQKQIEAKKIVAKPTIEIQPLVSAEEGSEIAKAILQNKLDKLRFQGAANSQLLIAEDLLKKQLGIEDTTVQKIQRRLDLEKAINEEKRIQNKIGSDSEKLYDIAKTKGVEVARQINDVLSGKSDLDLFMRRGGEAAEVFSKEFPDKLKQVQMQQFFKGERVTGEPGLRGGNRIAIQEEALRMEKVAPSSVLAQTERLLNVNAAVPVNFTINVDPSKLEELKQRVVDEIAKQLPMVGTKVNNSLTEAMIGKQGNSL